MCLTSPISTHPCVSPLLYNAALSFTALLLLLLLFKSSKKNAAVVGVDTGISLAKNREKGIAGRGPTRRIATEL